MLTTTFQTESVFFFFLVMGVLHFNFVFIFKEIFSYSDFDEKLFAGLMKEFYGSI